jgi:hypothetical protein
MSDLTRMILTADEAIAMLPEGDDVHTFTGKMPMLIGTDWSKEDVTDGLKKSLHIELSGEMACSLGHRVCFWEGPDNAGRWIFVETKYPSEAK